MSIGNKFIFFFIDVISQTIICSLYLCHHLRYPLASLTCITHLQHSLAALTCITHLQHSLASLTCITHLHHSLASLTCSIHLHHSLAAFTCITHLQHSLAALIYGINCSIQILHFQLCSITRQLPCIYCIYSLRNVCTKM